MQKMMIFDPQKRITAAQALKHPYFDGFQLNIETKLLQVANTSNKNFFNAANDFSNKPGSKNRIESRKDVLSRKSNVNKNSFYKSKALGKLPEYLPNKPTVVGSRGGLQNPSSVGGGYSYAGQDAASRLPNLQSSGGIPANNVSPYIKSSIKPVQSFQKYGSGIAYGGPQPNPYQLNY